MLKQFELNEFDIDRNINWKEKNDAMQVRHIDQSEDEEIHFKF